MIRRLLGFAVALVAAPALLAAQAPRAKTAVAHGKATQFQGEVVRPAAAVAVRTAGDVAHNETDGDKAEDQKDANEGPDVDEGPNSQEGPDADEGPKGEAQSQGEGDQENVSDTPSPAAAKNRVGRHKP